MLPTGGTIAGMATDTRSKLTTATVWREFARRLRTFIGARISNKADADDILQSIYLRIHRRLPSLRSDTRLEAWLYRIARNAITDFYRARAATILANEGEGELAPDDDAPPAGRLEIGRCLVPMLDRLSPEDREIIMLTDVGDATMAEAAARLNLSVPGAKSRAQRARVRLRKMFIDCCRVEFDATGRAIDLMPRRKLRCSDS
ncbi:MAG TPA: sigma-70 family RNA polymerase sigma factor [Polyangia bacterium]|nr:sigma-70 family RNA polymerase sigma factor [Polyangia bacterium]